MIKNLCFLLSILVFPFGLRGQSLTELSLTEAYGLLQERYPILKNESLLNAIHEKEIQQLDIAKLPAIFLKGDGRFQSQSTSLDTEGALLPFEINQPLVSVKAYAEANYTILDGGMNEAQRLGKQAQLKVDQQNLVLETFRLRERINPLFLNITVLREQIELINITEKDLQTRTSLVSAGVEEGIFIRSELTKLQVKNLDLKAQRENLLGTINGLIKSLADLIGKDLRPDVQLIYPILTDNEDIPEINRPESTLFDYQRKAVLSQSAMIDAARKPKLSAYAQLGMGYPNPLNILDNNVAPFGIIGAQFRWKLTDWKKGDRDREIVNLQIEQIQNAEANFLFNIKSKTANYRAEVNRLQKQIILDQEIAELQAEIRNQMSFQLEEGIITSADYINQVDAELSALQNLEIHKTQLLKTKIEFWSDRGAF